MIQKVTDEVPHDALYMQTENKAQLMAAIRAVPNEPGHLTIIDAMSAEGGRLARYTFPDISRRVDAEAHQRHRNGIAAKIRRTPAALWR